MIIVLDTNVIVSGILRPYSKAASILRLVATGAITLAYDLRIFSEYRDVLNRPKFAFSMENIDAFLGQVEKEEAAGGEKHLLAQRTQAQTLR